MKTIILAGGVGTRLWPLSREYYPKQFIPMEEHPFPADLRAGTEISKNDEIYVVTNEIHRYLVANQMDELGCTVPAGHILAEPEQKNTLPAIAWALQQIKRKTRMPPPWSSRAITSWRRCDRPDQGRRTLAQKYLVTFGVRPASPHTGYGYIRPGKAVAGGFAVEEFRRSRTRRRPRST